MISVERIRFADLGDVIAGQHIPADQYDEDPSGTPYLTGPADFTDRLPLVTKWTKQPRTLSKETDVLLTVKGAGCGKSNVGIDAAIGRQIMALRPNPSKLDRDYLFAFIRSQQERICQLGQGATVPGIAKGHIENIEIPCLPLVEQRRIAAILDKADSIRRKREEGIRLTEELVRSNFLEMFGDPALNKHNWPSLTIDDIALQVTDGEHATPQRSDAGVLLLSARNIRNGYIDLEEAVDYIPEFEFNRIKRRCEPSLGDILISCSGTIGRVTTVRIDKPFALVRSVALVRPDPEKVHPRYLEFYLRSSAVQRLMLRAANKSSQANLFTGPLKALPALVPPLHLQRRFADWLATSDSMRFKRLQARQNVDVLFKSLVQRAFRGEL